MQGVPPSAAQPGQDEQEQAVIVVDPRSPDAAAQHDDLLTEQGIFGQELRPCALAKGQTIGRPLMGEMLAELEKRLGRRLRPGKRGRRASSKKDAGQLKLM